VRLLKNSDWLALFWHYLGGQFGKTDPQPDRRKWKRYGTPAKCFVPPGIATLGPEGIVFEPLIGATLGPAGIVAAGP
jgi:hypothetical protein